MKRTQIHRKRATLETAAEFAKAGEFYTGPENYFSGAERQTAIDEIEGDLWLITKREFPRTSILEYAVLKAHLIVEHAITQYIRCFAHVVIEAKDIRFSFSQKLEVAYLLGLGANDPLTLPVIQSLNKCRNQVAHAFVLDREAVDTLLRINIEHPGKFKPNSDKERIRVLRSLCNWLCTNIAANISGAYWFASHKT